MSQPPPADERGPVAIPPGVERSDDRTRREDAEIALVEAQLRAGTLSPEDADRQFLEIALRRFDYLPEEAIEELREVGLGLNEEPEMVESRSLAPGQGGQGERNGESPS